MILPRSCQIAGWRQRGDEDERFQNTPEELIVEHGRIGAASLEIAFQIQAGIEASDLLSIAVEHLCRPISKETWQPDFLRLAPARMIDGWVDVA